MTIFWIMGISFVAVIFGMIMIEKCSYMSTASMFGTIFTVMGAIAFSLSFLGSIVTTSESKTRIFYVQPSHVRKTEDGFTIVTYRFADYQPESITSDKGNVFTAPDTNLFVRIQENCNHWGGGMGIDKVIVVSKEERKDK